jgi:alcohol dehydrogenase class IV
MDGQELHFGAGAVHGLAAILAATGARRVLLVTGKRSFAASGAERALAGVLAGIATARFHEFGSNPALEEVERGVALWRRVRPDLVVAVGGGSVIDVAKAVNALGAQTASPRDVLARGLHAGSPGCPLVAVPTTAGTGSEATHFATVYVDGAKHSLADACLRPAWAIVDPDLSSTLSPRLTAVTGLDALCQAIESWWAVGASPESQAFAAGALSCLWPAIVTAVRSPDAAARAAMARGAYLAGRAIDRSKTTAAHALSYALTTRFGIAHGHAVALTLGRFFEVNARARTLGVADPRGIAYVESTLAALCRMLGEPDAAAVARAWPTLLESLGLETDLHSLGVGAGDVEQLADAVNAERLGNHPVRLTRELLRELLGGLTGR